LITKRNFIRSNTDEQQLDEILNFFGLSERELAALAPFLPPASIERLSKIVNTKPSGLEYLRRAYAFATLLESS